MKLFSVPATHIDKAWKDGAFRLGLACQRTKEVTADQLKLMLSRGELQLLGAMDGDKPKGWAAVRIDQLPNYRALLVYAIHAPGAVLLDQLKSYAEHNGCTAIRGACDDAVSRLWTKYGAQKRYQIMEFAL